MPYTEISRKPYKSPCACGNGFLRFYIITKENDTDYVKTIEEKTEVEILCDYCKNNYHFEWSDDEYGFLVPNGLTFPPRIPYLDSKYDYTTDEKFIGNHDKGVIEKMISDMTAPKHRFIQDLTFEPAITFANNWAYRTKKRSLAPMVKYLEKTLSNYDAISTSRANKEPHNIEYKKQHEDRIQQIEQVENQSYKANFVFDSEQDEIDHAKARKERNAHQYDPFQAMVTYHNSYKIDATGRYWDTLHILECVEPQYLILDSASHISILKKYLCKCTMCGKEMIVLSSSFEVKYDEYKGYYPAVKCDCHTVSSFEAKAMDILNSLGISYLREFSFLDLVGKNNEPLRFDFAILEPESQTKNDNTSIRLLIELQGPHHYKPGKYDEYGSFIEYKKGFYARLRKKKKKRYDELKQQYCKNHGIILETIKYSESDYLKLEKRLIDILNKNGFNCKQAELYIDSEEDLFYID